MSGGARACAQGAMPMSCMDESADAAARAGLARMFDVRGVGRDLDPPRARSVEERRIEIRPTDAARASRPSRELGAGPFERSVKRLLVKAEVQLGNFEVIVKAPPR